MTKLVLNPVGSLQNESTAISNLNNNFIAVQIAVENTLSRDGSIPNMMGASLDMNSNRVLNLPPPTSNYEPLRVIDKGILAGGGITVSPLPAGGTIGQLLSKVSATNYDVHWTSPSNIVSLADVQSATTDGLGVINTTAATNFVQSQNSPTIRLSANVWDPNAPQTSVQSDWIFQNTPVPGTLVPSSTHPYGLLVLSHQRTNNSGYKPAFYFLASEHTSSSNIGPGIALYDYTTYGSSGYIDFVAHDIAGTLRDQAALYNAGFQYNDVGHEQTSHEFLGYWNGAINMGLLQIHTGASAANNHSPPGVIVDIPGAVSPAADGLGPFTTGPSMDLGTYSPGNFDIRRFKNAYISNSIQVGDGTLPASSKPLVAIVTDQQVMEISGQLSFADGTRLLSVNNAGAQRSLELYATKAGVFDYQTPAGGLDKATNSSSADGFVIYSVVPSTIGNPMWSRRLRLTGSGYDTGANRSKNVDFWTEVQPLGGGSVSGSLVFSSSIDSGTVIPALALGTAGGVSCLQNLYFAGTMYSSASTALASLVGTTTLYNTIYDTSASPSSAIQIGGGGASPDNSTFYNNNTHTFRNKSAATVYASLGSTGGLQLSTPTGGDKGLGSINMTGSIYVNNVQMIAPAVGKTLTFGNSLTLNGTDGTIMTFPGTSATIARTDSTQTFTGTQIFSSTISGSVNGNAATVTTNANLTGLVTSIGNVTSLALGQLNASLGSDVALNNTANYFDGPTIAQGSTGTWYVNGSIALIDTAGTSSFLVKLWDGTTVIASGLITLGANISGCVHLSGYITSPAGNLRISARDITSTSGKIQFSATGLSKDANINAYRIA